jgi:hypothetical protein
MILTDDDLKRLKETVKMNRLLSRRPSEEESALILEALLIRLEVTETIIINNERMLDEETPNLMEAWRKAAGK